MLSLKNITKNYLSGENEVNALKGVSVDFRKSEFVSVLGPSGCGKTTLLNIIGGLDKYTSGDLIIEGKSTKDFKERDWDAYRNHSVGFVFQNYNLIPHQTVLHNVELALTLSGVGKAERRRRALKALEEVGLKDQLKKQPNELSGGQMQRVAIARAIVNNPEIILADEPTGALDTKTSLQIMEILKSISSTRLVIMVTHNPELAQKYSTRIIKILDGEITDDSDPCFDTTENSVIKETKNKKRTKKPSMSLFTAFSLSLKNLFTKKGRTILTSFAGSIGIIGIALIFAVSNGMTAYINNVQEETLSSYPLTIEETNIDISTLLKTFMGKGDDSVEHPNTAVYEKTMLYDMVNSLNSLNETKNDLNAFKSFIERELKEGDEENSFKSAVSGIQYGYNLDMAVYTKNVDGTIIKSDTTELTRQIIADYMGMNFSKDDGSSSSYTSFRSMFSGSASSVKLWQEMLPGKNGETINDIFYNQYDVVYGSWPENFDEIVLVLDKENELDDITLYAIGLISKDEIDKIVNAAKEKTTLEKQNREWSYEDIIGMEFRTVLPSDAYAFDEDTGLLTDLSETQSGLKYLYSNALPLKVKGIIRPKENTLSTVMTGSIGYTSKLTEYIINSAEKSETVKKQEEDKTTDIFTGLPFKETTSDSTDEEKADKFKEIISSLSKEKKAEKYIAIMSIPPKEETEKAVNGILDNTSREEIEEKMLTALKGEMNISESTVKEYISAMSDDDIRNLFKESLEKQFKIQYAQSIKMKIGNTDSSILAGMLDKKIETSNISELALYYDETLEFSNSSYEENLVKLGKLDLDTPSRINLYASTFKSKDTIEEVIEKYNASVDDLHKIAYTDYVGIMMSSVTTIINAITYVLIAFVAISLIVSSIMIGVITLISVQERTKEIGILRAIGASKRNVSSMFNAETVIIGFTSGMIGVLVTYLLCIPINIVLHSLTNIKNLGASLPLSVAVSLIIISMLLTLFAGIIPSKSAAKKDPVVALRTE